MVLHRYKWCQFVRDSIICEIGNAIGSLNDTGIKRQTALCIMWTIEDARNELEAAITKWFDTDTAKPSKMTCRRIAHIQLGQRH